MAELTLHRTSSASGRWRALKIEVDGTEVARVGNDGTVVVQVPPGPHVVRSTMDWIHNAPLTVDVPEGGAAVEFSLPFLTTLVKTFVRPGSAVEARVLPQG